MASALRMGAAAGDDPFAKVKGLIEEMIAKLVNEANQEATQKAFCDEEISKSKASKDEKTMESEKITSRLDTATSKKNELGNSVNELQAEIAALDKAMGEATKLRTEEKATYDKASKDFKEAAEAVESAISLLRCARVPAAHFWWQEERRWEHDHLDPRDGRRGLHQDVHGPQHRGGGSRAGV